MRPLLRRLCLRVPDYGYRLRNVPRPQNPPIQTIQNNPSALPALWSVKPAGHRYRALASPLSLREIRAAPGGSLLARTDILLLRAWAQGNILCRERGAALFQLRTISTGNSR